ncbi:MAG TPA: alpha/beta hydrolase [Gammaproteobacteria bacterium]|nr:alpha/beta hydrolase [Gammaproteobacteria bacterium]
MTTRIDTGLFADVHGTPQWLTFRGDDVRNPALLVVGGPGAGCAALAPFFAAFEHAFTLVQWDQPGAGYTFGRGADDAGLTLERLVRDGLRAAEIACERLRVPRLALLCFSGGTVPGLQMVQRRPDLFCAYVGCGQFVDWRAQDARSYELLLERARTRGDAAMLAELTAIGPPPYADAATDARKSQYAGAPTPRELEAFAALASVARAALAASPAEAPYFAPGVPWPEPRARAFAAYTALRSELVAFDARRLGRRFALPVFFVQGAEDLYSVTAEVQRYAAEIEAPHVEVVTIDGAGHSVMLLCSELASVLEERVKPWLGCP